MSLASDSTKEATLKQVQTKSFVIGKKIENSVGVNLYDGETEERELPIKIIYSKKTFDNRSKSEYAGDSGGTHGKENTQDRSNSIKPHNPAPVILSKRDIKERPRSSLADKAEIDKKNFVREAQRNKLGPNHKPQISYAKKVQRPVSAPEKPIKLKRPPKEPEKKHNNDIVDEKPKAEIPFADNRFKGKSGSLTKELVKKAQTSLKEDKLNQEKEKEIAAKKKELEKKIEEEIRKKNQEKINKAKEKGAQHIDFYRKQQEEEDKKKSEENNEERQKRRELREKRNTDRKKQMGLDIFAQDKLSELLEKQRADIDLVKKENEIMNQTKISGGNWSRPTPKERKPIEPNLNMKNQFYGAVDYAQKFKEMKDEESVQIDKKQLLKEQKAKRKKEHEDKKKAEIEAKQKRENSLKQLEETRRKEREEFTKRKALEEKIREEQEKIAKELEQEQARKSKKKSRQMSEAPKTQFSDLQNWIDEQINAPDESQEYGQEDESLAPVMKVEVEQRKSVTPKKKEDVVLGRKPISKVNQAKNKHELPGNHLLPEEERKKLGVRQNRYGVYGDNGYQQVVEIQRNRLEEPSQQKAELEYQLEEEEKEEVKEHMKGKVHDLADRLGINIQAENQETIQIKSRSPSKDRETQKSGKKPRTVIIQRAGVPLFEVQTEEKVSQEDALPGVLNIERVFRQQEAEKKERNTKAALVIQKWGRGMLGRQKARKERLRISEQLDEEFSYFEESLKFNSNYNLAKFLKDRQLQRDKEAAKLQFEKNSQISEIIGESSALKVASAPVQRQVQNFMRGFSEQATDKDKFSIINVFADRHAKKKSPARKERPVVEMDTDQDIDEELYTEDFEKGSRSHLSTDKDIIEEDIPASGRVHSSGSKRDYRRVDFKESIAESIPEEDYLTSGKKSGRSDSIQEESHLLGASARSKNKQSSVIEESIRREGSDYESDFHSASGSRMSNKKESMHGSGVIRQPTFSPTQRDRPLQQNEMSERAQKITRDLANELQRYEQATLSNAFVDKLEKVMANSLAKKDQYIIGQVLSQLQSEKEHQEEINKLRDEQIKFLAQFALLGNQGNSNQSPEERQKILADIDKLINKPGETKKEPAKKPFEYRAQQIDEVSDYEEAYKDDFIEESMSLAAKQQFQSSAKPVEDSIKESIAAMESRNLGTDVIEEEIPDEVEESQESKLSKARMALGSEAAVREQSKKTISGSMKSEANAFTNESFQDFKLKKFKELLLDDNLKDFIVNVEKAIVEKQKQETNNINSQYKSQQISPRTYKSKKRDLEIWVTQERKELDKKKAKMMAVMQDMGNFIENIKTNKQKMQDKLSGSQTDAAAIVTSDLELEESSQDSYIMKDAKQMIKNLEESDVLNQAELRDLKYIEKKKLAAKQLKEKKERAIDAEIRRRLKSKTREEADKLLENAMRLDVNKEVQKRLEKIIDGGDFSARRDTEENEEDDMFERSVTGSDSLKSMLKPSLKRNQQEEKKEKRVNWAESPQKFSSYEDSIQSSVQDAKSQSSKGSKKSRLRAKMDQSIEESIKIEESYDAFSNTVPERIGTSGSKASKKDISESIHDDYSETFEEESVLSGSLKSKQSALQSKNKLQTKVDAMEESEDGYSMNFDEDSLGHSSKMMASLKKPTQSSKPFEEVKEEEQESEQDQKSQGIKSESMYESEKFEELSGSLAQSSNDKKSGSIKVEKLTDSNNLLQSSLSDDKELMASAASVDWHIELQSKVEEGPPEKKVESPEVESDYEEDFEEPSHRSDHLTDMQSFPEDKIEDFETMQAKADAFTDEIFALIMSDLKQDQRFKIEIPDTREDQYRNKFPYTELELAQEEDIKTYDQYPAPANPSDEDQHMNSSLPPLQINLHQYDPQDGIQADEKVLQQKYDSQLAINKQIQRDVEKYMDDIIDIVDIEDLVNSLSEPVNKDPLKVLQKIQSEPDESSLQEDPSMPRHSVLKEEFFIEIEKQLTTRNQSDHEHIHHKAIFDAFNEALENERLYKIHGEPMPWSKQTRRVSSKVTQREAREILDKAKKKVLSQGMIGAGTKLVPPPPPPPPDYDPDINGPRVYPSDEERRNQLREEKLGDLLTKEIDEHDALWINYEESEVQTKFDIADQILDQLASEMAMLLMRE